MSCYKYMVSFVMSFYGRSAIIYKHNNLLLSSGFLHLDIHLVDIFM